MDWEQTGKWSESSCQAHKEGRDYSSPFSRAGVKTDRSTSLIMSAACLLFVGQTDRMRLHEMRPHRWVNVVAGFVLKGPEGKLDECFRLLLLFWFDSASDYGSAVVGTWLEVEVEQQECECFGFCLTRVLFKFQIKWENMKMTGLYIPLRTRQKWVSGSNEFTCVWRHDAVAHNVVSW